MTRIERIKSMSIEDIAKMIVDDDLTAEFCKSDCSDTDDYDCPHPVECCVRWLNEEVDL